MEAVNAARFVNVEALDVPQKENREEPATISLLEQIVSEGRVGSERKVAPRYTVSMVNQKAWARLALTNVCGNDSDSGQFKYDLKVTTKGVDDRGFSIDSRLPLSIEGLWWNEGKVYVASCEQLAGGIVRFVAEKFPETIQTTVRVYNRNGYIELEWNQGEELPPAPRIATTKEIKQGIQYTGRSC